MKKIYLLTVALMAFAVNSMAQTPSCPPTPIAWKYTFSDPFPHCAINFSNSALIGQPGWQIGLVNFNGQQIPQHGTSDFWVDLPPQFGGATFYYDCATPGFVEVQWVVLRYITVSGPVVVCQIQPTAAAATPVKLTSFTGRLQNDYAVTLDWTSAMEVDSYSYEVERSADGKNFEKVGTLKAAGVSNATVKYDFTDKLPFTGSYFYRLKQIDFNGTSEYSKVVYVNSKKGAGVITKVFPNPFTNEIQLIGATSGDMTPANIKLYTISGQLMKYRIIGANAISIDDAAPKGIYILRFKEQQLKLVKQ